MTEEKNIKTDKKDLNNVPADEVNDTETTIDNQEEGEVEVIKETDEQIPEETLSPEEQLQEKVAELEGKLMRKAAEFDNYKKRTARQFEDIIRSANDKIILEFLEIIDNFNRSFEHDNEDSNFEAFREGVKLIFNQITGMLEKYNIEPIEAVGQSFDPNLHEAMLQVESDEFDEGTIAMEMSKGYKMGDRIIRHSKVGVAKKKEQAEPENDNEK